MDVFIVPQSTTGPGGWRRAGERKAFAQGCERELVLLAFVSPIALQLKQQTSVDCAFRVGFARSVLYERVVGDLVWFGWRRASVFR